MVLVRQLLRGLHVTLLLPEAEMSVTFQFEGTNPTPLFAITVAMLPTVVVQVFPFWVQSAPCTTR